MCTMQQGSASVNTGHRHFFDVVAFDSLGQPQMTVGEGLPLQAAISRSLGFNANPGRFIAAVVPSEARGPAAPAQNVFDRIVEEREAERAANRPVDAPGELDDSEAIETTEDAAWRNLKARLQSADEPDEDDEKTYRILCLPNAGGAPYLAEGQYSYKDAQQWIDTWQGDAEIWMIEQLPSSTTEECLTHAIERAVQDGDYPRLPMLGLSLGLVKHLHQVTRAIIDGKVASVAHIGMVARSLERFAAQCVDGREPDAHDNWDCDEFSRGMNGDVRDDDLEAVLYDQLDRSLEQTHPHLFEDAEA